MTLEESDARRIAEAVLGSSLTSGQVVITGVTEHSIGWAYNYQSSAYLRTGAISDSLGGNAPVLVHRRTGAVLPTGTAQSIDFYVAEHERREAWAATASAADLVLTAAVEETSVRGPKPVTDRVGDRYPEASEDVVDQAVIDATAVVATARKLARSHLCRSDVIGALTIQHPNVYPGIWEALYNRVR